MEKTKASGLSKKKGLGINGGFREVEKLGLATRKPSTWEQERRIKITNFPCFRPFYVQMCLKQGKC